MHSTYKRLGDFIREVKVKNRDGNLSAPLGINIDKFFMPSVANIIGTDLTNYKIVRRGQFACNRMHVGRDERIPVALSDKDDFIVSPAYDVFEITGEELLPDYLMMWFKRKEFDRNAWFYTDGDVRGGLKWNDFCEIPINIPSIETQREMVAEYEAVERRIRLNNALCQKLEDAAQALYRHWFEDFEFPVTRHCEERGTSDEATRQVAEPKSSYGEIAALPLAMTSYKSSGGKMVMNEELGKEIPEGWRVDTLTGIADYRNGFAMQNYPPNTDEFLPVLKIRELNLGRTDNSSDRCSVGIPHFVQVYDEDIIFSWSGTLMIDIWLGGKAGLNQHLFKVTSENYPKWFIYLWTKKYLDDFKRIADGNKTSMGHIKREHLDSSIVLVPDKISFENMSDKFKKIFARLIAARKQTQKLEELKTLLLGKMAV